MKNIRWSFALSMFSTAVLAADATGQPDFPPAQCMSQCELAGTCEEREFDEFPDFDAAVLEIESNCSTKYPFAVEGACRDGRLILGTGTGFTSEFQFYTADGEFESLITQTDVARSPCMGQSFWPRYQRCESPTLVRSICGMDLAPGSPVFQSRWNE